MIPACTAVHDASSGRGAEDTPSQTIATAHRARVGVRDREMHRVLVARVPQATVAHPGHLAEVFFHVVPVGFHGPARRNPAATGRAVSVLTCDNRIRGVS